MACKCTENMDTTATMPVERWLREQANLALKRGDFSQCNNLNLAAGYVESLKRENAEAASAIEVAQKVISALRAAAFEDADIMDSLVSGHD